MTVQGGKARHPSWKCIAHEVFLPFVQGSQLDPDTKRYRQNGWRMLQGTSMAEQRIDAIKIRSCGFKWISLVLDRTPTVPYGH